VEGVQTIRASLTVI